MHHVSCRFFWQNIKSPSDSAPLQPRFGSLQLLAFPKSKITLEREEISDCQWDSGKYNRAADGEWENCVRSQGACFEGTEASLSGVQCFLYFISSSISISNFYIIWLVNFWTDFLARSAVAGTCGDSVFNLLSQTGFQSNWCNFIYLSVMYEDSNLCTSLSIIFVFLI